MADIDLRTEAEKVVGAIVTNPAYPPGSIERYGAVADRSTDCMPAWEMAGRVCDEMKKRG